MTDRINDSRSAATVVIVRDVPGARPRILMMERASSMAFAGGALVFPGGAVDEADRDLAKAIGGAADVEETAARIAAIRETLEESGLGIGFSVPLEQRQLSEMRAALHEGSNLAELMHAHGLDLALDQLASFSRWHPGSHQAVRVFDTRFYVARAPIGQEASVDAMENNRLFWSSAEETLALCEVGEGRIIFPTRRNLERLAQFASFDDIVAHAASFPVEKICPWIEDRDGEPGLCIPGHLGYPVTWEPLASAQRG